MRLTIRLWYIRRKEEVANWIAKRLPKKVREYVIVEAAIRATMPAVEAGDQYCGPDGLTYKDLYDHA